MSEGNLKVAVVGMGKMGILHSCILKVLPQVELVALCEKSSMIRRLLKKVFKGVKIVDDVEELRGSGIDTIFVTTPIPFHFAVTSTICSERIARNLFVEKTLASNYEEASELDRLVRDLGGANMVGYLRRFYVTFSKAKDLLSEHVIGDVSSFKAYGYSSDFLGVKNSVATTARGGVLKDLGCHAIDLALWYFGDMLVNSAKIGSLTASGSEDSVHFKASNAIGLTGEFDISWCAENYRMPEVGLSIVGSEGVLEVDDDKVKVLLGEKSEIWYRHNLEDNVPYWLGLPEYYREDALFVRAALERCFVEPSVESACKVDQIIDQVKKKVEENAEQI